MRPGKKRQRRLASTAYWDVMVALSVLLCVGLLFWTYLFFSTVPSLPHYPKPGYGAFRAFWAENAAIVDQPLTLFTAILFLLSLWLFILLIKMGGKGCRSMLSERTALGAGFILITGMAMVTDDLIDIVTSQYRLDKWDPTPIGARSDGPVPLTMVSIQGDPEARYWAQIGEEWVFLPDADTLRIGRRDFRLWGIDALQAEQICVTDHGRLRCGHQAREALLELMSSVPPSEISCRFPDQARYPRTISCRAGKQDVAEWLVRQGYAYPTQSGQYRYRDALRMAQAEKTGAWATTFLHPRKWKRAANCGFYGVCLNDYTAD